MRQLGFALVTLLVGASFVPAPASGAPEDPWHWTVRGPVDHGPPRATAPLRRTADFTEADRDGGIAPSSTPHHRLVSATFDLDLADREFFGEATLAGSPPTGQSPTVYWVVGRLAGTTCNEFGAADFSDTFPGIYTNLAEDLPTGWETADCAAALLYPAGSSTVSDVLVGRLVDEVPRLSVRKPELLGSKKLGLVRGVWTKIDVPVANAGPGATGDVRVTGKGKGLKVRPGRTGFGISAGGSGTAEIEVKLVGRAAKAKLKLTAAFGVAKAKRKVTIRRVAPPPRPVPGSYRSKDGSVRFTITGGKAKVSGFSVRTRTDCGGIPTTNTYDFPKTPIPLNGIVDALDRGNLYTAALQLKVAGGKVTKGYFSYGGPGGCRASERFTASRR